MDGLYTRLRKQKEVMNELIKIERYVNTSLGININQNTRKRPIVDGRFLFFAIARKSTKLSLDKIGKHLNKDHATALHGINMFKDVLILNKRYNALYNNYIHEKWVDPSADFETVIKELRNKSYLLEVEMFKLKSRLKEKLPFLKGYYTLPDNERDIIKERINLMINMSPSNQKRKEVFEIINCHA